MEGKYMDKSVTIQANKIYPNEKHLVHDNQ
jgi:hypothetical protein